jgi:hypothetical protein
MQHVLEVNTSFRESENLFSQLMRANPVMRAGRVHRGTRGLGTLTGAMD